MKTSVLNWHEFMKGNIVPINGTEALRVKNLMRISLPIFLAATPQGVAAATSSFEDLWPDIIRIVDWLDIGVIVFAGTTWMFGNRTKAIEFLIGSSIGYLIVRHSLEINAWLKGI